MASNTCSFSVKRCSPDILKTVPPNKKQKCTGKELGERVDGVVRKSQAIPQSTHSAAPVQRNFVLDKKKEGDLFDLGWFHMNVGRYHEALQCFVQGRNEKSQEFAVSLLNDRYEYIQYELGLQHMQSTQNDEALQRFRQVYKGHPLFEESRKHINTILNKIYALGCRYRMEFKYGDAMRCFSQVTEGHPFYAKAQEDIAALNNATEENIQYALGCYYMDSEDYRAALRCFGKVSPNHRDYEEEIKKHCKYIDNIKNDPL